MTDADRMRAALVATPEAEDRDTAALVWADALQEAGDEALAEFIRVQVELSQELSGVAEHNRNNLDMILDPSDSERQRWKHHVWALQKRERALLDAHRDEWIKVECPECKGKGKVRQETFDPASGEYRSSGVKRCDACETTGDATRLTQKHGSWTQQTTRDKYRYPVTFRRGLPWRVEGAELWELYQAVMTPSESGHRGSTWEPTPLLRAWLTHHPAIEEVVVRGAEPYEFSTGRWVWANAWEPPTAYTVPPILWFGAVADKVFDTRADAVTALARAVVAVAKRL